MSMMMVEAETPEMRGAPLPSVRRLPLYLDVVRTLRDAGRDAVSCTHIAEELKSDPTQVRKDLSITGIVGKPKVGYDSTELIDSITDFLGWNNTTDAFLVGVGSLGTALLGYRQFESLGMNIVAAFDSNQTKVGRMVQGRKVLPVSRLVNLASRMHVHIGVLTVPAGAAQTVANQMVEGGITAIWNFTTARLDVPPNVFVERADFAQSLAGLTSRLRRSLKA